jgi:hypothetical protein
MVMSFINIYKNVIYKLCNFSNWLGADALWIDSFSSSSSATITLYKWNPYKVYTETYLWGTGLRATCWPKYQFQN